MIDALKDFFKRYAKFRGQSTLGQYWWMALWLFLIIICWAISLLIALAWSSWIWIDLTLLILFGLAFLVPSIALSIRRLQDVGLTFQGAWCVYGFVFLVCLSGVSHFMQAISSLASVMMLILTLLPTDTLVGKLGKLTRDK